MHRVSSIQDVVKLKGFAMKRYIKIISVALIGAIFIAAIAAVVNVVVCRVKGRSVNFFGFSFAMVLSESMEPEIGKGDLIIFKACNYDEVNIGDNIVFVGGESFGSLEGQLIVHSAVEICENGIVTKGVNMYTNPMHDKGLVTEKNLLGKCVYNSALWGKVYNFFSRYGILIVAALIFMSVIVFNMIKGGRKASRN